LNGRGGNPHPENPRRHWNDVGEKSAEMRPGKGRGGLEQKKASTTIFVRQRSVKKKERRSKKKRNGMFPEARNGP